MKQRPLKYIRITYSYRMDKFFFEVMTKGRLDRIEKSHDKKEDPQWVIEEVVNEDGSIKYDQNQWKAFILHCVHNNDISKVELTDLMEQQMNFKIPNMKEQFVNIPS